MRHVALFLAIGLMAACGERGYEEPTVETKVEYEQKPRGADGSSLNPGGTGGSHTPSDGTTNSDINQLRMLFQATVNGTSKVMTLTPEAVEGNVVLLMPTSQLPIQVTADDLYELSFVYQVSPDHSFPRDLTQVTGFYDTNYTDATSEEVKRYRGSLHSTQQFSWQNVESGYGFATKMTISGLGALNRQFADAGRTIRSQLLTFVLTSPTDTEKGIIISIPVVVGG